MNRPSPGLRPPSPRLAGRGQGEGSIVPMRSRRGLTRAVKTRFNLPTPTPVTHMNLTTAFAASAEQNAGKTAVFWGDSEYSYERLRTQSCWLAARLHEDFGVRPHDRVGLWLKNCPEFITAIFGVLQAGGVVVPINNFLKPPETGYILADAGAKTLITGADPADEQSELSLSMPGLKFFQIEELAGAPVQSSAGPAPANAHVPPDIPLRICISGAAPLPVEILKEFNERFPIPLIEGYGLSEASPVVSLNPIRGPWKAGSIGIPVPGVDVTVQTDAGEILPDGEVGEISVRGGNVMQGYWNQPEETAKAIRNDWLLTGDVGYRDKDGYFFITDRKKDMLLVNGINVYPREIEEIIYQFAGVKEAAVIGQPDPRKGEQPVAFVALNEGAKLDEKALLHFIRSRLADYKVPRRVTILPALPRNATGKVLKTALREL